MAGKRRQYGTGSVSQRSSDGLWIATIEAGYTRTGGRRRLRLYAKTRREVEVKLKNKLRDIAEVGLPAEGVSTRDTVKVWAERWLDITQHTIAPKTYATNASAIKRWVVPTIGHRRLDMLTPDDMRAVAEAQRQASPPSKPSSILRTHAVMAKMLKAGVVDGGYKINPRVLIMDRPKKNDSDRGEIPLAHALAILRAAGDLPDGSRWLVQLLQGVRQAEALGLTWNRVLDLDGPNPSLDISWQLQALPYLDRKAKTFRVPDGYEAKQLHGAQHLTKPKTEKGKRVIPLIPPAAAVLREWRDQAPANPHNLVWARLGDGRTAGLPRTVKEDVEQWLALQKSADVTHEDGRHYGTHELRHTAATTLRAVGASDETIKAILGHATILSTKAYLHTDQAQARAALEAVGQRLQLG